MPSLRRTFAILALALVIAPLAARAPLFDPDEGLHAAIAQEMVRTGDYVTPRFLGEPFLDKPILFFWAEAVSLRVFGMNEAAVRIPPLLFGVLGMISVAQLGRGLFGDTAGVIAGIVYGTMLLPLGVSEVAIHDVAVVPFMCAAVYCLLAVSTRSAVRRDIAAVLAGGVFLGLSILTKGLVAIAFTGIFAVCLAIQRPTILVRLVIALTIAILIAAAVAAPWYLAMERAHPGYLHYYFIERHLQGYLTTTQRHAGRGWWYYFPIIIGGSLPWTGYLFTAARRARADSRRLVVWAWLIGGFVFLSAGESKLVTYALPLFPAIAVLVGDAIATAVVPAVGIEYAVYALTLAVLPIGGIIAVQLKFGGVGAVYWAVEAFVGLAVGYLTIRRLPRAGFPRPEPLIITLAGVMIASSVAAAWMTGRDVAAKLNESETLPSRVLVVQERIGSLIFYLEPRLRAEATRGRIDQASMAEAIQRSRGEPLDAVIIVRNNLLERFERQFTVAPVAAGTAGTNTVFRVESLQNALQGTR
ncbi:MAG TPA: glycosyltransferase family 39 protein [Vicinamibacterales bacterium]